MSDNNNSGLNTLLIVFAIILGAIIVGASSKTSIGISSSFNETVNIESNGGIPVNIQDQTTPPIDFFFTNINGPPTNLTDATSIDSYELNVSSVVFCSVGDYLGVFNADLVNDNRATFGEIQAVVGTTITLDTPLDFAFQPGDTVGCFDRNLNVDGSLTNQIYSVQVGPNATQSIDITRIMISFVTDDTVALNLFGDQPSLTNGVVLRRVDGDTRNIWNVKNNGDIANLCFDYDPFLSTNPVQGQDGAKFRCTFSGQEKHGVAIRLAPGDELQLIIQDDLSGINQFRVIAEGHYVLNE